MARKRAGSEEERLDDASMERVIKYMGEKGATKKVACQMLNISYNTTRLDKLLDTYKQKKENDQRRRAEKRGKPATPEEVSFIVTEYLEGNTLGGIGSSIYRGSTFIKSVLDAYAVPERNTSSDYFHPKLIPEEASRLEFGINETVYSARYDVLATVIKEVPHKEGKVYQVWLRGDWRQYAYQPAWELASLHKLREAGIIK